MKAPSSPDDFSMPPEPAACAVARESLQRRLDREAHSESAEVLSHRASCAACASWEEAARRLEHGLRQAPPVRVPENLADRILAKMQAEPARRRRRIGFAAAGLALAASVAIVVFAIAPWEEPVPVSIAITLPQIPEPKVAQNAPPEWSLDQAESAVASLTRKTANQTLSLRLPSLALPDMTPSVDPLEQLEPAVTSIGEIGHGAVFGVAPITNSARRAVDMFWRELGPDTESGMKTNESREKRKKS